MNFDKALLFITVTASSLCYITLFVSSFILFRRTKQRGFFLTSLGFALWVLEHVWILFAKAEYILVYVKWQRYMGNLGLVLLASGFVLLLRRNYRKNLNMLWGSNHESRIRFYQRHQKPIHKEGKKGGVHTLGEWCSWLLQGHVVRNGYPLPESHQPLSKGLRWA